MPNTSHNLLNYLRTAVGAWRDDPRGDAVLLARFAEGGDEAAFRALVWRHGLLVWQTCRRILGDTPDAEDAFQTTFLALARKAGRFPVESLAGWLHRTARRAALNADAGAGRRRRLEQRLRGIKQQPRGGKGECEPAAELYAALDEELVSLPERLRVPLLLHYLEGRSQVEVARLLGCARSALQKRLMQGEAILRQRLERRGLTVGIGSMAALLGASTAASSVPPGLIGITARTVLRSFSFLEPSPSATLAEEAMKSMLGTKVKMVAVLVGMTLCLAGSGLLAYQALAGNVAEPLQTASEPEGETEAPRQPEATARVDCFGDPLPAHALARMGTTRLWRREEWRYGDENAFAFSPDSKMLATLMDGMTVCLWDAATGKEIRRLITKAVQGHIIALGFSPDGKTLITVNWNHLVCRWEVATGKFLRKQQYQGPTRDNMKALKVAFLPDGKILGFGNFLKSGGKGIRGAYVWDLATGKDICQLSRSLKEGEGRVENTVFSPDGKLLANFGNEGKKDEEKAIHLWDVATGKEIRQLIQLQKDGCCVDKVAFSPDNKTLASADNEKICVWEVATGKRIHRFQKAERFPCNLLIYSPDGKTLLGGSERVNHLWDIATGEEIRSFGWKHAQVAFFSPDSKILAVVDNASAIRLWEVATGKEIGPCKRYRGPISSIAYSPDGKTLASTAREGETMVRLWEVATGKEMRPLVKHAGWGWGPVAYSPDGKMLVSMEDSVLHLWDAATGKEIRQFKWREFRQFKWRESGFQWWATFSPDGKKLAANWECERFCVWEVATGQLIYTLETHQEAIGARQIAIAFSPDGRLLATPSKDNTVSLWDAATGKLVSQLGRPKKWEPGEYPLFVFCLAFSPDSRLLAVSSSGEVEGKVRVWEVISGQEIGQLKALKPRLCQGCVLAFSPDGRMLATAAQGHDDNKHFDPAVRLWEVASGRKIGQLTGHQDAICMIAFSPDGKTLASGSEDLTCLIWDVTPFTSRLQSMPARPILAQALSPEQLAAVWADLAQEPAKAYAAIRALQAVPTQAITLLQARVRPVDPPAEAQQLKRWIADLDAGSFTVREKAQRKIEKLGASALPTLRQALKCQTSTEVRRRLKDLLAKLEPRLSGGSPELPERLRELRAIQVLESLGTAEAQQFLQALAKGVPEARLTQEAQAALARLTKRSAARP